jgi:integrase/recombinase XerD
LAVTGMRISEALALRFEDVTAEGLRIRHAKFQKSRLLALHPSTQAGLERYLQRRRRHGGNDDHIFISVRNRVLHYQTVRDTFQALMAEMGLQCEHARQGSRPRIHDLRHNAGRRIIPPTAAQRLYFRENRALVSA